MVTYTPQNGRKINSTRRWGYDVHLDGKRVGYIERVAAGWRYKPLRGKAGETFATLDALKASLGAE